jgi:chorismate mutase / prephenate dehydrogenase
MGKEPEQIIESCRNKISAIDKEILSLIKQREQLSIEIGRNKRTLAIPDRDFSREKVVFENTKKTAQELGLPANFAMAIQRLILEDSLSRQEQDRIKNSAEGQKSVLVVGGAGRLGQWLCRFFADSGHHLCVVDLNHPGFDCNFSTTLDKSADSQDIIVVATPIRVSIEILERIHQLGIKKPVIFDVSSVKAPVQKALVKLKQSGAKVTSLHPMFGPSVELLFGKHIIRTSLGVDSADQLVHELFRSTSLTVVDMSIDEHDEIISILLALAHLINIVFVHSLQKSRFSSEMLERFSSPTFANLLSIAKRVLSENPRLYFEIQALNPHTKNAHNHLKNALSEVTAAIEHLDEEAFVAIMNQGKHYLKSPA